MWPSPFYELLRVQWLPISLEEAWKFFSDPRNLSRITPPSLQFEIRHCPEETVYAGMLIWYRVRPIFRLPVSWVTEIVHVNPPFSFIDEQRIGPYALWHHEHRFEAKNGGTEMLDRVGYVLPRLPFSGVLHDLVVAPRLEEIFEFRRQKLLEIFPIKEV